MAQSGDVLEHPVTGEKFIYLKTASDTGGELFQIDFYGRPGAFVAAAHIHPQQSERFSVISGTMHVRMAGKELVKGPGDELVIPPGTPHVWWNGGDDELHVTVEFRPALRTENFFETFFGLAQDGKVSRKTGLPNLLQMALTLSAFRNELILAQPPRFVQTPIFGALGLLGKLLGYTAEYPYPHVRRAQAQPQAI